MVAKISMYTIFISVALLSLLLNTVCSKPSLKIHICGDDLKYLVKYVCTYPDKKLPCFSHFLNNTAHSVENPLLIIDMLKQKQLQHGFEDSVQPFTPTPLLHEDFTLIETCCHIGCNVTEVKKKYRCFTQQCLNLCYPEKFDVFV